MTQELIMMGQGGDSHLDAWETERYPAGNIQLDLTQGDSKKINFQGNERQIKSTHMLV